MMNPRSIRQQSHPVIVLASALILSAACLGLGGCKGLAPTGPSQAPQFGGRTAPAKSLFVFSQDKWWLMDRASLQWVDGGLMADSPLFRQAPRAGGQALWEGAGITAAWFRPDGNSITLVSKDRFWVLNAATNAWGSAGLFADLPADNVWKKAPRVAGQLPWEGPGITAGWHHPDGILTVVSRDKYWRLRTTDGQWVLSGEYRTAATPWSTVPRIWGQAPWEGSGITAGLYYPDAKIFSVYSRDRVWNMRTTDNSWILASEFSRLPAGNTWLAAPPVGGQRPYEGPGITAAFYQYPPEILVQDPRRPLPAAPAISYYDPAANQAFDFNRSTEYVLNAVDDTLRNVRPALPEPPERRLALLALDECLLYSGTDRMKEFRNRRLDMVVTELRNLGGVRMAPDTALVWKLDDMAFVVRTATATLAFDLTRGHWGLNRGDTSAYPLLWELISFCDVLFVSQDVVGHKDNFVRDEFLKAGKPVVAAPTVFPGFSHARLMRPAVDGNSALTVALANGRSLTAWAFPGHLKDGKPNTIFVVRPEGNLRVCHTGAQGGQADWPMLESLRSNHAVNLLLANCDAPDLARLAQTVNPRIVITGGENDMSATQPLRRGHFQTMDRLQACPIPFFNLAWGDSHFYDPARPDTAQTPTLPGAVDPNIDYSYNTTGRVERMHAWATSLIDQAVTRSPGCPEGRAHRLAAAVLDVIDHHANAARSSALYAWHLARLDQAAREIASANVTSGLRIWKLYNMGCVVKTPSVTVAFDLTAGHWVDDRSLEVANRIVDQCDVLMISHLHSDHQLAQVRDRFRSQNKPVLVPPGLWDGVAGLTRPARHATNRLAVPLLNGRTLQVAVQPGHQGETLENNCYVVISPENLVFVHTGDQSSNGDFLNWLKPDVMTNAFPTLHALIGSVWATDMPRMIAAYNPRLTLMGHQNELGHDEIVKRKPYYMGYDRVRYLQNRT